MICIGVDFLVIILLVFYALPGSVVWCLSLILENSQPLLFQIFVLFLSFSSFWYSQLQICYTFYNCPTVLGYSLLSFSVFFYLNFNFVSFYWHLFKFTDSFLSHVQSNSEPIKGICDFYYSVFLISSISFWFFLRVFISLLNLPIQSYILSTFSIRALSILVIVVFFLVWSFQQPCHIWVWFWCLFCHFRLCVLPFSMSCKFLLKARCDVYWIKETEINIPLMWCFTIISMGVM